MPALNRVQLIGRLGRNPETRTTPSGKKVAIFSMAVSLRRKSDGNVKEFTDWVNVETWGSLAEVSQKYLKKGSLIDLEGHLKTDKYEDKGGETKYFTKVVAIQLQFLDKKEAEEPVTASEEEQAEYEA